MDSIFGLWLAGASLTGFLFLAGWIRAVDSFSNKRDNELQIDINKRVLSNACATKEATIDEKVTNALDELTKTVNELKDALLGTLDKKGMITTQREHEQRIERLEKKSGKKKR